MSNTSSASCTFYSREHRFEASFYSLRVIGWAEGSDLIPHSPGAVAAPEAATDDIPSIETVKDVEGGP